MITKVRESYLLLLSYNPCDVFTYFNVEEMHGLSLKECQEYNNTPKDAYIAGWSNFVPKESGKYTQSDPRFLFINLSRCTDSISTFGLIMHELIHQSFNMHKDEEDIITWAELESYEVFKLVKENL